MKDAVKDSPKTLLKTGPERLLTALDRLPSWLVAAILMITTAVVIILTFDPRVERGGDNALYWSLAQSLAEGRGYRNLVAPGAPFETSVPWGYPALLAIPVWLGASYAQAKALSLLCMVGAVGAFWGFLRRLLPAQQGLAALVGLLLVIDHRVLGYGASTLSEAPYLLFSMAALWTFEARSDQGRGIALPALLAGCAYLIRPAGVSLILGLLFLLALTRRWKDLAVATGVIGLVAGSWHLWAALAPSDAENLYLGYLLKKSKFQADDSVVSPLGMLSRIGGNAAAYTTDIMSRFVLGRTIPKHGMGPQAPLFLLALAVGWAAGWKKPRLVHLYLPLYVGVLLAWLPESVNARYFAVGFPLMMALAVVGLWRIGLHWSRAVASWLVVLSVTTMVIFRFDHLGGEVGWAFNLRARIAAGEPLARYPEEYCSFVDLVTWLGDHSEPGAVVVARKPRLAWYYSGHPAIRVPNGEDPDTLMDWLDEHHADYLVIDRIDDIGGDTPATLERFERLLVEYESRFKVAGLAQNGDRVLQILPAEPPAIQGAIPAPAP